MHSRISKWSGALAWVWLATGCVHPDAQQHAAPLQLVSPEEAALAPAPLVRGGYEDSDEGPHVELVSPELDGVYSGPFPIRVRFEVGRKGLAIERDSLRVYYRKMWDIDITSRLDEYLDAEGIRAPSVELPSGQHTVRIYIEDVESNATSKTFRVVVK